MFKSGCRLTLALCLSAIFVAAQSQPPATNSAAVAPKAELATISGRVVRATDGAPLKKAVVVAYGGRTGQVAAGRPKFVSTDADGNFVLKDLEAGRYMLADILDAPFHLAGTVKPLEIVISTNGGRVEGTVSDDKANPFTGARVVLVPDEAHRKREELYKAVNTDQYGRFSFRGVAPGAYTIYAWESLDGESYMDPDFLKTYADAGKPVRVSESSQITADLKVIPDQKPEGN